MKTKIRFFLEGGGSKCSYQTSFLSELLSDESVSNTFELDSLWGISFGAIVSYLYLLDKSHILNDFLLNGNQILIRSFDLWGYYEIIQSIPFIGNIMCSLLDLIWILYSVYCYGLFKQDVIEHLLRENYRCDKNLAKLNVIVFNITKNKTEIVNGTHPLIIEYILASSACWLLFPPKKIRKLSSECDCDLNCNCNKSEQFCTCLMHQCEEYMDNGMLHTIPFDYNDQQNEFVNCYLLTNNSDNDFVLNKGANLFEYLFNIIDCSSHNYQRLLLQKLNLFDMKQKNITHVIYNNSGLKTAEIDIKKINNNLEKGKLIARHYINHLHNNGNIMLTF